MMRPAPVTAGSGPRPSAQLWVVSCEHQHREGYVCAGKCTFPYTGAVGTHNSELTTHNSKCGGFSLIEVLISMAILSMVVGGTLGLFTVALHRTHDARSLTRASALGRSVMERVSRPSAHLLFDASGSSPSIEKVWARKVLGGELEVTEAEGSGGSAAVRDELREMFLDADLPYGGGEEKRNELAVRIEALPIGTTFANASMLRVEVRVLWTERGVRSRELRLDTLQVRRDP